MLPVKTMPPLKDSKKTSAAASKIKNKILSECVISVPFASHILVAQTFAEAKENVKLLS